MKPLKIAGLTFTVALALGGMPTNGVSQVAGQSKTGQGQSSFQAPPTASRLVPIDELRYSGSRLRRKIRELLAASADLSGEVKRPLASNLRDVIVINQPESGNVLLSIVANREDALHRRAVNAITQTWDTMNVQQAISYFERVIDLKIEHRERYPRGVGAIEMRYELVYTWGAWPSHEGLKIKTVTRPFVDGKPYGRPYSYEHHASTIGWITIDDLSPGKHTAHLEQEYEFTHQDIRFQGRHKSETFRFEVVGEEASDGLSAPFSPELEAKVRAAFHVAESEEAIRAQLAPGVELRGTFGKGGAQQTRGRNARGESYQLQFPYWAVAPGLPVDLFFDVEIHDLSTGKVFKGNSIEVRRGDSRLNYFGPYSPGEFVAGRNETVPIKVVLKPSRALALSRTWTTQYYTGTLTFDNLRATVSSEKAGAEKAGAEKASGEQATFKFGSGGGTPF